MNQTIENEENMTHTQRGEKPEANPTKQGGAVYTVLYIVLSSVLYFVLYSVLCIVLCNVLPRATTLLYPNVGATEWGRRPCYIQMWVRRSGGDDPAISKSGCVPFKTQAF